MYTTRANILLEVDRIEDAIADCEKAIKINPNYMAAYKAYSRALCYKNKLGAAYEMLKRGWVKDKENVQIKALMELLDREIKMDSIVPKDHPERGRMQRFIDWMKGNGARFPKIKMRICNSEGTDW